MVDSDNRLSAPDIAAVLANYPPDCQPTSAQSLGAAGGMSGAQFWRLTTARGGQILRRWPHEFPPPERLRFIHAVLRHAAGRGIGFLPIPATTRQGETFVEFARHLWELAPLKPGVADYEQTPSAEKLRTAMIALAQFHNAVADFNIGRQTESSPATQTNAVGRHAQRLRELERTGTADLTSAIADAHWPDLAPLARRFLQKLPRALPVALRQLEPLAFAKFPLLPCIRDIWHEHVLFLGNTVTGLIDFGAVEIDTPATDITRLLGSLESVTPESPFPFREGQGEGATSATATTWSEGLNGYQTERMLTPDEIRATQALHTSGTLLAGCNWIRWIYGEHREFEDHTQVVKRFRHILAAMSVE